MLLSPALPRDEELEEALSWGQLSVGKTFGICSITGICSGVEAEKRISMIFSGGFLF